MVNSGSFDSDGDRSDKFSVTQSQSACDGSHSSNTCKTDLSQTADSDLPSTIEPTLTKTAFNGSMSVKNCPKNRATYELAIIPKDESAWLADKSSVYCSLPLEKVKGVLTPYHPLETKAGEKGDVKVKQQSPPRKLLCLYCERTFVCANLRHKHVERCHSAKQNRRVSARRQNQLTVTPCIYCDRLNTSEHTLNDLFIHLIKEHSDKYFGCLSCEDRFLNLSLLNDHNASLHLCNKNKNIVEPESQVSAIPCKLEEFVTENVQQKNEELPLKITRSKKLKNNSEPSVPEEKSDECQKQVEAQHSNIRNSAKLREMRSKRLTVKTSRIALKRSKRLQAQAKEIESQKKKRDKRLGNTTNKLELNDSTKFNERTEKAINPYPEFDHFYRVKKITDHSIDNLKINALTFDDVFDKAFFNRIKCNIEENLLNFIDGKLFENEESETRISNFEKISNVSQEVQHANSENYGCELSLNAVTPVASLSLNSQFGEDFESQIEYGSKPSKKKTQTKRDEVHYKYFTRRKFQASILEHKENRDLSKLDMWTQLVIKKRQQKILDEQKSPKEILEYTSSEEYKSKLRREELNRVLDRRGPFEDLKEEASKKAALEKLNSSSDINISEKTFSEVRDVLNFVLNKVFELTSVTTAETVSPVVKQSDQREVPWYLNLRRASSLPSDGEIDKSDHISLICSSQETENFELPTNKVRDKNEMVELTGEWARCRMYVCAACGDKLPNMKYLLEHKGMYHQNVWAQHYELVGNQSELYRHLSIPGLGKVGVIEDTSPCKFWKRSDARTCAKCGKQCNSLGELHRHILECGEDWTWMLARKKCKYRPFGAKSRKKRRGLIRRIHPRQKTDPSEKKLYKKTIDGPRQRPSDADTIQRMLANLPAKRSRRNIISLQDVLSRRKRKVANKPDRKSGKPLRQKQGVGKRIANNTHIQDRRDISSKRRSLRSLTKVLSSRILDTNASLMVKRKLKAFSERRLTRRAFLAEKVENSKTKVDSVQEDTSNSDTSTTRVLKKHKKSSENVSETSKVTPEVSKRSSPRISKNITSSMSNKKVLGNTLNIKSFFPVKKKKNIKIPAISNNTIKRPETNTEEVKPDESKTKRKSKENREDQANRNESVDVVEKINGKKVIQNLVKVLNRRYSRRKKPQIGVESKKEENKVEEKDKKPEKIFSNLFQRISKNRSFNTATERVPNKTKKDTSINIPKTRSKPIEKDSRQLTVRQNGQRLLKNDNKKRKLTRNFRSVIDKVKKLKLSNNVDQTDKIIEVTAPSSKKELPVPSGVFLEKGNVEKENPLQLDKVVVPLERKENTADSVGPVLIVVNYADFKENPPIPETIFNLESNNEKPLQAKGELDFDKSVYFSVSNKAICDEKETVLKNKDVIDKTGPINIDVSPKSKNVPQVSPNLKGKFKKPSRGLNDCIAMLTNKLQQKEQPSIKVDDTAHKVPTESEPQPSKKLPNIPKQECILRIPTFKVTMYPEETALDLSKKSPDIPSPSQDVPCASQTLVSTIDKVIEDVIENKCKEVFTETVKNNWNSVDVIIQEVIDGHKGYEKVDATKNFTKRSSIDETIEFVVNDVPIPNQKEKDVSQLASIEFVVNDILSTPSHLPSPIVRNRKKTRFQKASVNKKKNSNRATKEKHKNDTQLILDGKSAIRERTGEVTHCQPNQETKQLISSFNSEVCDTQITQVDVNEETTERDSIIKEVIQSTSACNETENINLQHLSILKDMIALSNSIKENAAQREDEHASIIKDIIIDSSNSKYDQTTIKHCPPAKVSNEALNRNDIKESEGTSSKVVELVPTEIQIIKNGPLNIKRKQVKRPKKKATKSKSKIKQRDIHNGSLPSNSIKENAAQREDEHAPIIKDIIIDSSSSKYNQTTTKHCPPAKVSNEDLNRNDIEESEGASSKVVEVTPTEIQIIKNGPLNVKRKQVKRPKKKATKSKSKIKQRDFHSGSLPNHSSLIITDKPVLSESLNISPPSYSANNEEQKIVKPCTSRSTIHNNSQLLILETVDPEKKLNHSDSEDELPLAVLVKLDDIKIQDEQMTPSVNTVCENVVDCLNIKGGIIHTNDIENEITQNKNVPGSEISSHENTQVALTHSNKESSVEIQMKSPNGVESIPKEQVDDIVSENPLSFPDNFDVITSNEKADQLQLESIVEHGESRLDIGITKNQATENVSVLGATVIKVKTAKLKRNRKRRFGGKPKRRNLKTTVANDKSCNKPVLESQSETNTSSEGKSSIDVEISPNNDKNTDDTVKDLSPNNYINVDITVSTSATEKCGTENIPGRCIKTPDIIVNPTDSTVLNAREQEDYISDKQGITKQKTRRKSKSFKKIGKVANDLFKDFALVINKKTKRIPPTNIVDDSVCDDTVTDHFNILPITQKKPSSVTSHNIICAEVTEGRALDDSIEEMDMEIEEIAVNSTIIERNNVKNENVCLIDLVDTSKNRDIPCVETPAKNNLKMVKKRRVAKRCRKASLVKKKPLRRSARNHRSVDPDKAVEPVSDPTVIKTTLNNFGTTTNEFPSEILNPYISEEILKNGELEATSKAVLALDEPCPNLSTTTLAEICSDHEKTSRVLVKETLAESLQQLQQPEECDFNVKSSEQSRNIEVADESFSGIVRKKSKRKTRKKSVKLLPQNNIVHEQHDVTKVNISNISEPSVTNSYKFLIASDELLTAYDELPITSGKSSVASDKLPVAFDELPISADELLVTSDELLLASDELLVTSDELPVASDESPVASEKLPATESSGMPSPTIIILSEPKQCEIRNNADENLTNFLNIENFKDKPLDPKQIRPVRKPRRRNRGVTKRRGKHSKQLQSKSLVSNETDSLEVAGDCLPTLHEIANENNDIMINSAVENLDLGLNANATSTENNHFHGTPGEIKENRKSGHFEALVSLHDSTDGLIVNPDDSVRTQNISKPDNLNSEDLFNGSFGIPDKEAQVTAQSLGNDLDIFTSAIGNTTAHILELHDKSTFKEPHAVSSSIDHSLEIEALKSVLGSIKKSSKKRGCKISEHILPDIEPLTHILTSSDIDIAPVIDEIDKSLEIDDIYDFNDDLEPFHLDHITKKKSKTKKADRKEKHIVNERITPLNSKSTDNMDSTAVPVLPLEIDNNLSPVNEVFTFKPKEKNEKGSIRSTSSRTAKTKALEHIHDEALFEQGVVKTVISNNCDSKKKLQKNKKRRTQNDNVESVINLLSDVNVPAKDVLLTVKNSDTAQINEASQVNSDFVLDKNCENETKSVQIQNTGNLDISDKRSDQSAFSEISKLNPIKLSETNGKVGKEEKVIESSGKELRRSRRVLPKVASYNENDLIDPLIDALEKKRLSMKKDKPSEKTSEVIDSSLSAVLPCKSKSTEPSEKMTSDELFDLLKITSNENDNMFMLKTQNSFLNNLDESNSTRDFNDFDNVFENILEKSTLLIRSSSLIAEKDENNVYEFTISSPESSDGLKPDVTEAHAELKGSICETEEFSIPLGSALNSSLEGILSIPPTPTPDTKELSALDSKTTKSKDARNEQTEKNYCEICNKYFIRVENLIKHRRTLTHISKLSEIEAKEAAAKSKQENKEEIPSEISVSSLKTVDSLRDEINITDILQQSEQLKVHTPQAQNTFENNHSLKLADIINDVLNKPVLDGLQNEKMNNFSEIILQTAVDSQPEFRRCKSLGERKSFESDKRVAQNSDNIPNNNNYFPGTESKTTILEKQISLLENIIENQAGPLNNFIDEISLSSNNSPEPQNTADLTNVNVSKQTVEEKQSKDDNFLKPTQYEEISEDSANLRNYEDQKLRKTLNRDEELFLECCSLLKSSSEISSFSKKSKALRSMDLKQLDEPEWLENKSLVQTVEEAHEFSDNSRTPTPLGDTFDDEASNSNTISSNWEMKKGKEFEIGKRKSFSFEEEKSTIGVDLETKNEGANFGEIISSTLKSQFGAVSKHVESEILHENSESAVTKIINKEESDCSVTESKKIITKGARKVFEGLKVSIPTEDLDLKEVLNLNFSASSKHLQKPVAEEASDVVEENKVEADGTVSTPTKPPRKSRPIKNSQVGSNVLFKKSKKWNLSKTVDNKETKEDRDIYDFEETQDNTDIFMKPDFKRFRNKKIEAQKEGSDCESKGCTEPSNIEGQSTSSISSVSVKSLQKSNPPENVTKKKCMIMGRIFKNAAKSKVDEIDEEIRAIPEIDNLEFVENYVLSCAEHVQNNQEEISDKPKMTEKEMNILFDQLLGKPPSVESKTKPNLKTKPTDVKKKVKPKNRKRARANSVSDDDFNINKTTRKRTSKKQAKEEDNCINLEQELRECIGVASRKSQRKCTSGKQNILVEYWSSDEEAFEALLESKKIPTEGDTQVNAESTKPNKAVATPPNEPEQLDKLSVVLGKEIEKELLGVKTVNKKSCQKAKSSHSKKPKISNNEPSAVKSATHSNRRKRAAAHPLYHWSSSSEDESHNLIEVKPIREDELDDDEDRPVQHGWIVGDSPKKLVTMLALTKGKKSDADCVKEQGKKRTNAGS